jgi:anti-repressor protein
MNELKVFENKEFGQVRTITKDGEPWFITTDICRALEIGNVTDAISRLEKDEVDLIEVTDSIGRQQKTNAVSEPGLYALVLGSRKPEARAFKRWITHEVIPSIRKHGMYATPDTVEAMLADPDTMIQTLQTLKEERSKRVEAEKQIEQQKPLVEFAETCQKSSNSLLIREFAKVLCKNGFNIGEKRLYKLLREWGLVYKYENRNLPRQRYVDKHYFEVVETPYMSEGEVKLALTTRVLPKGQEYIINKLAV